MIYIPLDLKEQRVKYPFVVVASRKTTNPLSLVLPAFASDCQMPHGHEEHEHHFPNPFTVIHVDIQHSHGKWPIEIDGLPSYKMVIFHGYVK